MSVRDEQPIVDAIKAAIQVELGGSAVASDADEVPGVVGGANPSGSAPQRHVEVALHRVDAAPSRRASGEVTVPDWELITRCHADSIVSVRELRRRVGVALEDRAYDRADGGTVGPFRFAISEPVDQDDTGWLAVDHWTFA
ncbi:hypothetical protein [Nocardioides aromaticivorans]|uniref:hypothetical protein n=1 Tax=Nocardioides aromaticivorans TaxID=200618 RepID=UPI001A8EF98E|nr:hypothetical protein [Nocardioides aromaticivorans]